MPVMPEGIRAEARIGAANGSPAGKERLSRAINEYTA